MSDGISGEKLSEDEKAMLAVKRRHENDEQAKLDDYEKIRRSEREKLEEELKELKEKQEQRRFAREKEEREYAERRRQDEERRKKEEEERRAQEEKGRQRKENYEKRRVAQYLHGFGGQQRQQPGGRNNYMRAKLAAKLAGRKKNVPVVNQLDSEKEVLRAQLLQEAAMAQVEMQARQAERILLEERLRVFQARLEKELVEAAEYAAQRFLEKEEKREREEKERLNHIAEEIRREEQAQKEKSENVEDDPKPIQEREVKSEPSPMTYKQQVMARLEQYEIARFAFLEALKKKYYEQQMQMEISRELEEEEKLEEERDLAEKEKIEENKTIIQEYLLETQSVKNNSDSSIIQSAPITEPDVTEVKPVVRIETSAEHALMEKVMRKLKTKLEKRVMMKRQQKREEMKEVLKHEYDEDGLKEEEDYDFCSWDREEQMEHAQYMRRGYRGDF